MAKKAATTRTSKKPAELARKNRTIYSAQNRETLPGVLMRSEGGAPTGDVAVDEAYDGLGSSYDFFWDEYKRDSIDGKGMPLVAVVHYGKAYDNAFWSGKQVIVGDGDGRLFQRLTIAVDILAKEFSNGVLQNAAKLRYWGQSGAVFNSTASIFAVLVKQWVLRQRADQADWLHGAGVWQPGIKGRAISSFAEPGSAYDDAQIGKDSQPGHMRDYNRTETDNGGVHINSGILNRAFYLAATAIGGYAWDKAGRIWYKTICDKRLKSDATFKDFALLTIDNASKMFGAKSDEVSAVEHGWSLVGVRTTAQARSRSK